VLAGLQAEKNRARFGRERRLLLKPVAVAGSPRRTAIAHSDGPRSSLCHPLDHDLAFPETLAVSRTEKTSGGPITLDQLLALSDEMAALVRAGIPLEQGLTALGRDSPRKFGLIATRLADRLRSGENLTEILQRDALTFPPAWRSVVLAGIRSGHLAAALEGLSQTVRRAAELRRSIAVALIYPFIVVAIAYGFLLFTLTYLAPILTRAYHDLVARPDPFISWIEQACAAVHSWALWVPAALALCLLLWWYRSGRAIRSATGPQWGRTGRFLFGRPRRWPTVSQAMRDGRMATFAELLRLMNDHQVPMPEAVVLAADASGDRVLSQGARRIAERLESGAVLRARSELPDEFPPLLGWSIVSGAGQTGLSRALAASAEMYRQRAAQAARWAAVYLPIVLTVVIGGSAVLFHGLLVFWPFTRLLYQLGMPQ
jgi:type II secretory pathway component PulF